MLRANPVGEPTVCAMALCHQDGGGGFVKKSRQEIQVDRTRVESMLRMLEGNTHPDDLKRLHREWLLPILSRLQDPRDEVAAQSE